MFDYHPITYLLVALFLLAFAFVAGIAIGRRERPQPRSDFADFYRHYRNEMNRR